jgi:hypothetical protein
MHTQRMLFVLEASLAVIALGSSDIAIAHPGGGGGSHGAGTTLRSDWRRRLGS